MNNEEWIRANSLGEFVLKRRKFMDSPLLVKSKQFALDIIKVCNSSILEAVQKAVPFVIIVYCAS